MAIVTFLGVFPVALLFSLLFKPLSETWPPLIVSALFNVCIVASLTWVVMPLLTRWFKPWLNPPSPKKERTP